jgi:type IV pilus assembly protein PilM
MKGFFQRYLPKKSHFIGVDVGTYSVKVAVVQIIDDVPEVISLKSVPAPEGVWTDHLDEESLVGILQELQNPELKEVITCIGGEKTVIRIVRLPQMSDKELETAIRFEVEKFVPVPIDQLIIRHVRLGDTVAGDELFENVLLLVVPAATIYQYYGIFARAGLTVTAIDFQAFALWRLFGREIEGTVAILDIGAGTSQLVIVKDGVILFVRRLPVGGNILTQLLMDALGVDFAEAQQMQEMARVTPKHNQNSPGGIQLEFVLRDGLMEIYRELQRSLEFFATRGEIRVERLLLSGGISRLKWITTYLSDALEMPVQIGFPDIDMSAGVTFDPAFSVAVGLALREISI